MPRKSAAIRTTTAHRTEFLLERSVEAPPGLQNERYVRITPTLWVWWAPDNAKTAGKGADLIEEFRTAGAGRIVMSGTKVNVVEI